MAKASGGSTGKGERVSKQTIIDNPRLWLTHPEIVDKLSEESILSNEYFINNFSVDFYDGDKSKAQGVLNKLQKILREIRRKRYVPKSPAEIASRDERIQRVFAEAERLENSDLYEQGIRRRY